MNFFLIFKQQEKEKLDLNIYYLRKVHHYCYYCATEFDDEFELYQKCASIHLRRKHGETIDPDFENGNFSQFIFFIKKNICCKKMFKLRKKILFFIFKILNVYSE